MICTASNVPEVSETDIAAMRAKYLRERDRRIKRDHNDQYVATSGKWADIYEVDPYTPVTPREPVTREAEVVILGAGYCGMMVAAQLKKAGISDFYNVDHGGSFGGTWYWNRYPGIQCDNDSLVYMPLLEETNYMPSKKFADGYEIHDHCQIIANTFGLRDNALFHTLIKTLKWDPVINRWHVGTNRGDDIKARFVVLAMGPLNKPKLPGIPGLDQFKGKVFHTARWDYDYTGGAWRNPVLDKLGDKRVAIIGTGATAIQVVPFLARYAGHTYVVQRTPSTIDARDNRPIDPAWFAGLKPGWQQERIRNFHHAAMERLSPGEPDMVQDIWTEISRNCAAQLEAEGWPDIPADEYMRRREVMDYRVMERLRRRCDVVTDPAVAEALKPYYRYLCKRPASNDDYYPAFNQPNVTLIDVAETRGLERLTETGFVHQGEEYPIDCLIMASGYEVTNDLDRRWGIDTIEGQGGLSIYDYWREGYRTFQGMMAHRFPNMFFTGFTQAGTNASNSKTFIDQGFHIGYIASEALKRGAVRVEPTQEAQDAYIRHLRSVAVDNLFAPPPERTPSSRGRPAQKGSQLPKLKTLLSNPTTRWSKIFVSAWYGHASGKALEITSGVALWYRPGTPVLPVRWVLVRDPDEKRDPQAFFSTDITFKPADVIALYVRRWQIEVTFAETRAHLGVETQRQWTDKAISRTTSALLGLYSLVSLWACELLTSTSAPHAAAWYRKTSLTFSDAIGAVRLQLWIGDIYPHSPPNRKPQFIPPSRLVRMANALCFAT